MLMTLTLVVLAAAIANPVQSALPDFDSLWNYDKPAETETAFRNLLPQAEQSGNTAYRAELLTQIARTLGLQQKFAGANMLLDKVDSLLPTAGERARVRYLLERGRVRRSSGKPEESPSFFTDAYNRAVKGGFDFFAIDAAHMMGIVAPPEEAMQWNLKAVAMAEKSTQPKAHNWLGSLYNNIGWSWFDKEKYDSALDMFGKALAFRKQQGVGREVRIAKWCVAKTFRMMKKVDTALAMQRELLDEWKASGEESDGYVHEELAECLLTLGKPEEAAGYFAQAFELLSKDSWLATNEVEHLNRLKRLGNVK